MIEKYRKMAADLGLAMGRLEKMYNSRRAQELRCWAEAHGRGDAFNDAVYRAFFAEERNIYSIDVLADIAKSIGLCPDDAAAVLRDRRYRQAVDADWQRAQELELVAAPTLLLDDTRLVGAQSYEKVAAFLEKNGVAKQ